MGARGFLDRSRIRLPSASTRACQPGSIMLVPVASVMMAGPSIRVPWGKVVAVVERHVASRRPEMHGHMGDRGGHRPCRAAPRGASRPVSPIASTLQHLEEDARSGETKPKRCAVAASKLFAHLVGAAERHLERLVRAVIAQMRGSRADAWAMPWRDLLARLFPDPVEHAFRLFDLEQGCIELHLAHGADLGEPHAIGRQHARQGVDEHRSIPSASATRQACCPPAPPKHCSV
jgi:hypothetical protein